MKYRSISVLVPILLLSGLLNLHADNYEWNNSGGGDLTVASNWLVDGSPPATGPGEDDTLTFNLGISAHYNLNLDSLGPTATWTAGEAPGSVIFINNGLVTLDLGEDRTWKRDGRSSTGFLIGHQGGSTTVRLESGTLDTQRLFIGQSDNSSGTLEIMRGASLTFLDRDMIVSGGGNTTGAGVSGDRNGTLLIDGGLVSFSSNNAGNEIGQRGNGVLDIRNGGLFNYTGNSNTYFGTFANATGYGRIHGSWLNPETEVWEASTFRTTNASANFEIGERGEGLVWVENGGRIEVASSIRLGTGTQSGAVKQGFLAVGGSGSVAEAGDGLFVGGSDTTAIGTGQVLIHSGGSLITGNASVVYGDSANVLWLDQGTLIAGTTDTPSILIVEENARIEGRGSIQGSLNLAGDLRPGILNISDGDWVSSDPLWERQTTVTLVENSAGQLEISNNLQVQESARVYLEINSLSEFSSITADTISLDGGLIDVVFNYTPTGGSSFILLASNSFSGNFDSVDFHGDFDLGLLEFDVVDDNFVVSVIPEPGQIALIVIGVLALAHLRRHFQRSRSSAA